MGWPPQLRVGVSFALVASAVLLVAAGCSTSTEYEKLPAPSDQRPCRPGTGAPISEQLLRKTLRANGVGTMRRDHERCDTDARVLSELSSDSWFVSCTVFRTSLFGRRIERYVYFNDTSPTYVRVLNVACAVQNPREVTDTLEKALRKLPGVSTKPTFAPNATTKPD